MTGSRAICISSPFFPTFLFHLLLFIFIFILPFLAIVTRKAPFDYFADIIRRIEMRMFLFFLCFALNSRYTRFFLFLDFFVLRRILFRLFDWNNFSPFFSSVAFYVALFLFHGETFRRFSTDFESHCINLESIVIRLYLNSWNSSYDK